jgi:hypothetical protein
VIKLAKNSTEKQNAVTGKQKKDVKPIGTQNVGEE